MDRGDDPGDVRELIRSAVGQLAPDELPRFDEVWQAYLDNPRASTRVLTTGDAALGAGIDVLGSTLTPLITAIASEALADLAREPVAGATHRLADRARRLRRGRRGPAERRAALTGPAPAPGSLQHDVVRALILHIARESGCPDESAKAIAGALASVFAGADAPGQEAAPGPGAAPGQR